MQATGFLALTSRRFWVCGWAWLLLCALSWQQLALANPAPKPAAKPKPKPTPKKSAAPVKFPVPSFKLWDMTVNKPPDFTVASEERDLVVFERSSVFDVTTLDPKAVVAAGWPTSGSVNGWCQMTAGIKEMGNHASLKPEDCKRVCQTLFPYLESPQGLRWKKVQWHPVCPSYWVEFSGVSLHRRMYCKAQFTNVGGLLYFGSMTTLSPEMTAWKPLYENWLRSADWGSK